MKPLNTLRFWKKSVVKKILREFEKNEKGERQLEGKRRLLKEVVYITSSFITEYIYLNELVYTTYAERMKELYMQ